MPWLLTGESIYHCCHRLLTPGSTWLALQCVLKTGFSGNLPGLWVRLRPQRHPAAWTEQLWVLTFPVCRCWALQPVLYKISQSNKSPLTIHIHSMVLFLQTTLIKTECWKPPWLEQRTDFPGVSHENVSPDTVIFVVWDLTLDFWPPEL